MLNNETLKEILRTRQASVELDLKDARARFKQTTDIGTEFEMSIREVLEKHLPAWTSVGNGEIIDSKGTRSAQTDVIITNQDQPFRGEIHRANTYIIEGVVAAGEVKSDLTSEGLADALAKAAKFKQLGPFYPYHTELTAHPADAVRYYKHPPWFLVANDSQVSLERVRDIVQEFIGGSGWEVNKTLDAAFVLKRGWLINVGDGKGLLGGRMANGSSSEGWMLDQDSESVLSAMIVWLSVTMLKMSIPNSLLLKYCQRP